MKCPRCSVPLPSENEPVCLVCGYQFGLSSRSDTSIEIEIESTPRKVEAALVTDTGAEEDPDSPFDKKPRGLRSVGPSSVFVGRTDDLARLREELNRVNVNRRLSFVTVHGPAGIGKTRLLEEFGRQVASEGQVHVLLGSPRGQQATPYSGVIDALARFFELDFADNDAETVCAKFEESLKRFLHGAQLTESAHLFTQFLGHELEGSAILEPLLRVPSQIELRVFIALRRILGLMAEDKVLLLIMDAVDVSEPETVNLINYLAAGLERLPVMILTGGRDNLFTRYPQWSSGEYATLRLRLPVLGAADAEALLGHLLPSVEKIPKAVANHVQEHMDRSPRAIEELARLLIESEVIDVSGTPWKFRLSMLATTELPYTLEGILRARIYLLPDGDHDILNRAATFGETFWQDGVVSLIRRSIYADDMKTDHDGPSLDSITRSGEFTVNLVAHSLERHVVRGFIEAVPVSQLPGERQFRFKYPPIWNIVYDSTKEQQKKIFHYQAAEWLQLHLLDPTSELLEEVGRHLELAGAPEKAALSYQKAADLARTVFLNDKAIRLYIQALSVQNPQQVSLRIQMWHDLGNVYETKGQFDRALSCYEKMLRLSWVMASRAKGGVAFNKMGRLYRQQGKLSLALEYLKRGLNLFEAADDLRGVASSHDDLGTVLYALGDFDEAMRACGEALEIRRRLGDARSIAVVLTNIGFIEIDKGLFNEAASCFNEALALNRNLGDQSGVCRTFNSLGILHFHQGQLEEAVEDWQRGLTIAQNIGYGPLEAKLQNNLGEALLRLGKHQESRKRLERAIELSCDMHEKRVEYDAKRNMGLVLQKLGQNEEAMDFAMEALALAKELDILEFKARAAITIAEILSSTAFSAGDPESAAHQMEETVTHFQQGIDFFKMLKLEREIALSLKRYAEFLIEAGRDREAHAALKESREILGRLGMKELEDVKKLLATLDEAAKH